MMVQMRIYTNSFIILSIIALCGIIYTNIHDQPKRQVPVGKSIEEIMHSYTVQEKDNSEFDKSFKSKIEPIKDNDGSV